MTEGDLGLGVPDVADAATRSSGPAAPRDGAGRGGARTQLVKGPMDRPGLAADDFLEVAAAFESDMSPEKVCRVDCSLWKVIVSCLWGRLPCATRAVVLKAAGVTLGASAPQS